jgi:hypothetical protein
MEIITSVWSFLRISVLFLKFDFLEMFRFIWRHAVSMIKLIFEIQLLQFIFKQRLFIDHIQILFQNYSIFELRMCTTLYIIFVIFFPSINIYFAVYSIFVTRTCLLFHPLIMCISCFDCRIVKTMFQYSFCYKILLSTVLEQMHINVLCLRRLLYCSK